MRHANDEDSSRTIRSALFFCRSTAGLPPDDGPVYQPLSVDSPAFSVPDQMRGNETAKGFFFWRGAVIDHPAQGIDCFLLVGKRGASSCHLLDVGTDAHLIEKVVDVD